MPRTRSVNRTSIQDVAAAGGVSLMTVSRSLRGVDGVSEATRSRIVALAAEMNYVPSSSARALSGLNANLIGISFPTLFNDVFPDILEGMRRIFDEAGYSSVMDTTDYDRMRELAWADRFLSWRPAAVILTGVDHDDRLRRRLTASAVPTLEIWDVTQTPIDICVGIDHRAGGLELGRRIAALGYRRPAYVGAPAGLDPRADQRFDGVAEAFRDVGGTAPTRVAGVGGNSFVVGAEGFGRIDLRTPPDVVFFLTDNMAFGGMMAAQKAGLRVPEDIGIVGFNGLDLTTVLPRPITTMTSPRRQIGLTGARHLLARLHGVSPPKITRLPCEFVPGSTVRAQ
ncbi:LacI family DNA-binding transcriptional regulator [Jannaschia sp. 2305UL9-9]|uniref:LacI family DNA-binding transcriptional regulator n=1 Tax=Jannaschia sp. 2305UL9-9 TaxID=3121638 RepID=UPI003528705E